jgi:hypothetical protein
MKAKLILSVFVLGLVSSGFGTVIGDFEGGSSDGWWLGWATSITPVQAYPSTGTWSMEGVVANGGWVGLMEKGFYGTPEQSYLATKGEITLDVTSFYNTGSSNDYAQLCVLVNANDWWNVYGYVGVQNGVQETITLQLPADAMAAIGAASSYANIGILSNHSGTESYVDDITGETIVTFDGRITHYMDNIQISVPEPASLALLGLGSLSLLRRKR